MALDQSTVGFDVQSISFGEKGEMVILDDALLDQICGGLVDASGDDTGGDTGTGTPPSTGGPYTINTCPVLNLPCFPFPANPPPPPVGGGTIGGVGGGGIDGGDLAPPGGGIPDPNPDPHWFIPG